MIPVHQGLGFLLLTCVNDKGVVESRVAASHHCDLYGNGNSCVPIDNRAEHLLSFILDMKAYHKALQDLIFLIQYP